MLKHVSLGLVASALMAGVTAQTTSACNPTEKTGCPDDTGLTTTYSYDFTKGEDSSNWESIGSGDVSYTSSGAEFTINKKGNAPTIESEWYIFFGRVEVHMKAASGQGIVSSAVLLSDDLDEIDWEWLGGENEYVQTNYFSKGDSSSTAGENKSGVSDSQGTSHNYTIDWTKEACTWYIDGASVRTLSYSSDYPQTPMRVKLGIWAGGDSDNAEGTIEWAGGETDYTKVPFTMTVESIKVTNYNPAASYTYSDQTGTADSITINKSSKSSSSSSKSSTKTTLSTKASTASDAETTGTKTSAKSDATATGSAAADKTASATPGSSSGSNSGSGSGSSSTPTGSSSSSSATSSSTVSLGFALSPSSVLVTLGAAAAVLLAQF